MYYPCVFLMTIINLANSLLTMHVLTWVILCFRAASSLLGYFVFLVLFLEKSCKFCGW